MRVHTTGADLVRERRIQLLMDTAELDRRRMALLAAPQVYEAVPDVSGADEVRVSVVRPLPTFVSARSEGGLG